MSSWKAAENRIGIYFGAKGINKSGRVPLSGGGSGTTRSDTPHRTIFIESKRDKSYHSVIKLWRSHKKCKSVYVQALPTVHDGKIIGKISDLWCFYSRDFEYICNNLDSVVVHQWSGNYPRAYTLYHNAVSIKNSSVMDAAKKIVCCALVYHGSPGFWVIIHKDDIKECWRLIQEERKYREELIEQDRQFEEARDGVRVRSQEKDSD